MSSGNFLCCACVSQDEVLILEKFGKFSRVANAGFTPVACCFCECLRGSVSTRVQQLDVQCETKTKDNVFVQVIVSVQYQVLLEKVYEAFYRLTNPRGQITAYVFDVVRSTVPKINLDDVFDSKDEIANAVREELKKTMPEYGYDIIQTLVTDITPDAKVKTAMNEINAAQRQRVAATDKAEAEKILIVKAAEADAESKYLSGVGLSRQRQAIVNGLQESVVNFTNSVTDLTPKDVLELMMMTQYFDMLKDVGANGNNNTIFVSNAPGSVNDFQAQIRNSFLQASSASNKMER